MFGPIDPNMEWDYYDMEDYDELEDVLDAYAIEAAHKYGLMPKPEPTPVTLYVVPGAMGAQIYDDND